MPDDEEFRKDPKEFGANEEEVGRTAKDRAEKKLIAEVRARTARRRQRQSR